MGEEAVAVRVSDLVIAGWTGRDPAAVEKHIAELEALGVGRPAATPVFYRAAATRLTTADRIEVSGHASSGEVEFVLLGWGGRLWIGVGSDHTDRDVETYNVTVSKQMCDKPIASRFWPFDDVSAHWDRLILRSHILENGERKLYQQGEVSAMRHPLDLISRYSGSTLDDGTLMFCGTLPAIGGIRAAGQFDFELEDPLRHEKISHCYRLRSLPM